VIFHCLTPKTEARYVLRRQGDLQSLQDRNKGLALLEPSNIGIQDSFQSLCRKAAADWVISLRIFSGYNNLTALLLLRTHQADRAGLSHAELVAGTGVGCRVPHAVVYL